MVQISHSYMTTGKTISLTRWTFVSKVMSLLFNKMSKFVISFLPRRQLSFNFMGAVTISSDLGAQENKICHCFHFASFFFFCHEVMELDATILVFWMLSFKPDFSLSTFTFIKRLFSSSSLFAIRVVSSAYLRLLIFLPTILIPAWDSSSPAFHLTFSANKLNKQGDSMHLSCIPFPILNQSVVPCPVLTVAPCVSEAMDPQKTSSKRNQKGK